MSNGKLPHRVGHLYGLNRDYREEVADFYIRPDRYDCGRYTLQELAEQDDVVIRMTRDHQRNNVKPSDTFAHRKELGQALCMALDIMIEHGDEKVSTILDEAEKYNLDVWYDQNGEYEYGELFGRAVILVGYLLYGSTSNRDDARIVAYIVLLCDFFGYNPVEMVHERYAQVKAKWGQNAVGKGGQESITSGEGAA